MLSPGSRPSGYPLTFFTEASLDLADDEELMQLMVEANISTVFVGIESPNEESLRETKKFQNVRKAGSIVERVHAIQRAGMEVWCGMIVGFDNDDPSIFDAQHQFLEDARIANAMIGMLFAIPKTPLHARLVRESRIDFDDVPAHGTNVIPLGMSREELRDGYIKLMTSVYAPEAYFGVSTACLSAHGCLRATSGLHTGGTILCAALAPMPCCSVKRLLST